MNYFVIYVSGENSSTLSLIHPYQQLFGGNIWFGSKHGLIIRKTKRPNFSNNLLAGCIVDYYFLKLKRTTLTNACVWLSWYVR